MFTDEVRNIVQENISNHNFGACELASQLGLSNSQTLRKLKATTGKSVNQYIREFRLKEATKLIKNTDETISEISYKVGFGSPSYFNKVFHKHYGVAPGEYKTQRTTINSLKEVFENRDKFSITKKRIIYVITAFLVGVLGYSIINNSINKNTHLNNSIAVLPFKDLSPIENQWFCDGVSDNILHSLSQMKDLKVTSFTSSSTYRNTKKQIPKIAKELGVSYILEGSVVLYEGEIKVITQLIDANDQHVWSKEYNDSFENIIDVQKNVAQEVMQQLQLTLSPEEEKTLEKYPTKNMEAYHLYMEGRRINESKKQVDLIKNIENNKKAIALDPNFVEAYSEIAATKMIMAINSIETQFGISYIDDPITKIKEAQFYVNKALEIDPNSAKANAVKARLLLGNEWNDCETYFKKAIALNPNDAESRHWYANYFLIAPKPDIKQALEQVTIANQLSPFSSIIAARYTWILILNEKYNEAEAYLNNYEFLLSPGDNFTFKVNAISRKNKDWQPVFDWGYTKLKEEPENAALWNLYFSLGYDTIFRDKEKAIAFAKKAYDLNSDYFSEYFRILNKHGFLEEAEQLLKTDDFNSLSETKKSNLIWYYHYCRKDYNQALDLIKENPNNFGYFSISQTYAQLGDHHKLDSLNKLYNLHGEYNYSNKAIVHAILKQRDSMYYYLNKLRYTYYGSIPEVNSDPKFDAYRNDENFKSLLREFYIPFSEE